MRATWSLWAVSSASRSRNGDRLREPVRGRTAYGTCVLGFQRSGRAGCAVIDVDGPNRSPRSPNPTLTCNDAHASGACLGVFPAGRSHIVDLIESATKRLPDLQPALLGFGLAQTHTDVTLRAEEHGAGDRCREVDADVGERAVVAARQLASAQARSRANQWFP